MKEKYTIELTQNQASQLNDVILGFCKGSWAYNPPKRLEVAREPEVIVKKIENPNGNAIYDQGFEDGVNSVSDNSAKVTEVKDKLIKKGYDQGFKDAQLKAKFDAEDVQRKHENELSSAKTVAYNSAISDYNSMIEWINDCPKDYEKFLFEVYGLSDCQIDKISLLYDLICSHDIAKVLKYFQKWLEKKKSEKITIGDIVKFNEDCVRYSQVKDRQYLVLSIDYDKGLANLLHDNGDTSCASISLLNKTNKHICEIEHLIAELIEE